jgi:organic radical activating enzyme
MNLPVVEAFTSIQGEGPRAGRLCAFLRFGGCNLSCGYSGGWQCVDPQTQVLMADWTEKSICEIRPGELVMSYRDRRYEAARVERTMTRHVAERVTVVAGDREVICTPDHIFANPHHIDQRRRTRADELMGRHVRVVRSKGWAPDADVRTDDWWRGWAQGLILGDGHVSTGRHPQVWLRVCDKELPDAYCRLVNRLALPPSERGARNGQIIINVKEQKRRTTAGRTVYSVASALSRIPWVVGLPEDPDEIAGFLGGFFDAEGSVGRNQITISQKDDKTLDRVVGMVRSLGIPATLKYGTSAKQIGTITVNGAANVDAFLRLTRPLLDRKTHKRQKVTSRMLSNVPVFAVKETEPGEVVNLTTSTGYFFAGGMLVENCDTPYTWDSRHYDLKKEFTPMSPVAIVRLVDPEITEVVITGGEPLIHQRNPEWDIVLRALKNKRKFICVETNGTIAPTPATQTFVDHYSISPKLSNTLHKRGQNPELAKWPQHIIVSKSCLKFVVTDPGDVKEAVMLADGYGWPRWNVYVMPEGTCTDRLQESFGAIAEEAIRLRVNVSHRLQILAFGDRRGT